jgi:ferric-chelate reductase
MFGPVRAKADGYCKLDSLYSLLPDLLPLMHPHSSPYNSLSLRFNVHWTRASSRPPAVPRTALPQGMYLRPGRPDIHATLQNAIAGVTETFSPSRSRNHDSTTPSGIAIGTCGPTSLVDDATRAVGRVNWSDWGEVGGVESIEECVFHLIHTILAVAGPVLNGLGIYRVFGH